MSAAARKQLSLVARMDRNFRQHLRTRQEARALAKQSEIEFTEAVRAGRYSMDRGRIVELHGHRECRGCGRNARTWHVVWWEPASALATTIGAILRTDNYCAVCMKVRLRAVKREKR